MENMAFRALAAVTAGFFWLAIMRFLSSYDEQVAAQEKTDLAIIQMQHKHDAHVFAIESKMRAMRQRLQAVEKNIDATCIKVTVGESENENETEA